MLLKKSADWFEKWCYHLYWNISIINFSVDVNWVFAWLRLVWEAILHFCTVSSCSLSGSTNGLLITILDKTLNFRVNFNKKRSMNNQLVVEENKFKNAILSVLKCSVLWLWTSIVRMFITLLVLLGLRFFSGYIKLFFLQYSSNALLLLQWKRNFVFIHKSIKHVLRHQFNITFAWNVISQEKVVLNTRFW